MELKTYICLELKCDDLNTVNLNESEDNNLKKKGGFIAGLFKRFFNFGSDSKDDPVTKARKEAIVERKKALEEQRAKALSKRKEAQAELIRQQSAKDVKLIKQETERIDKAYTNTINKIKRETAYINSLSGGVTARELQSMVESSSRTLKELANSGQESSLSSLEKAQAVMQKYCLNPETGEPWTDMSDLKKYLKDHPEAKSEIEGARKGIGESKFNAEDAPDEDYKKMFKDANVEIFNSQDAKTELEEQIEEDNKWEENMREIEAYEEKVKEYEESKKKYEDVQNEYDSKKSELDESYNFLTDDEFDKDKFESSIQNLISKNVKSTKDEDGNDVLDTNKTLKSVKTEYEKLYGPMPKTLYDSLDGKIKNSTLSGLQNPSSNDAKFTDDIDPETTNKIFEESNKVKKNKLDTLNAELRDKQNKSEYDEAADPSKLSEYEHVRELKEDPDYHESVRMAKRKEHEDHKNKLGEIDQVEKDRIELLREQQKAAAELLSTSSEQDDPKLAEIRKMQKELQSGLSDGEVLGENKNGELVPGYYDKDDNFIPKPSIDDEEARDKYFKDLKTTLVQKENLYPAGKEPKNIKKVTANDDGTFNMEYVDSDGNTKTDSNLSAQEVAQERAKASSRASAESHINAMKAGSRSAFTKIFKDMGNYDSIEELQDAISKGEYTINDDIAKQAMDEIAKEKDPDKRKELISNWSKNLSDSSEHGGKIDLAKSFDDVGIDYESDVENDENEDYGDDEEGDKAHEEEYNKADAEDPRKKYHKKKKKNGKGTTKNYYTSDGQESISPEDFKARCRSWKKKHPAESLRAYLSNIFD